MSTSDRVILILAGASALAALIGTITGTHALTVAAAITLTVVAIAVFTAAHRALRRYKKHLNQKEDPR